MADWQRDNDHAEKHEITAFSPSLTNYPKKYGGNMTHTDDYPRDHWSFVRGDHNMNYLCAKSVHNFSVCGHLPISKLAPGCKYKGVFELELTNRARGWQDGIFTVSLDLPAGSRRTTVKSTTSCPSDKYHAGTTFNLSSKTFQLATFDQRAASRLGFTLSHTGRGQHIRNGLIIRRFVIQPA